MSVVAAFRRFLRPGWSRRAPENLFMLEFPDEMVVKGHWPCRKYRLPSSDTLVAKEDRIRIPVGQFFLIRRGRTCGAVKWTKPVRKGNGGYSYEWFYQSDGSGSFINPAATSGKGEVFTDLRGRRYWPDETELFSDEGRDYLQCGELCVKWALGNWLHFDDSGCAEVEIAVTGVSDINDVDCLDNALTWYGQRHEPAAKVLVLYEGVEVPVGTFFLVRRGDACAAFRLTRLCSKGTRGYEYEGFGHPDGSGRFTGPGSERATGEVFETWKAEERGGSCWSGPDHDRAKFLTCGEMQVEWSSSDTISFDAPGGEIEIAITNTSDIAEVNCLESTLTWYHAPDSSSVPIKANSLAVCVPAQRFVLARNERGCAAFKLADRLSEHAYGYEYVWYWQADGSGGFAHPGVESGKGEVFDDYEDYCRDCRRLGNAFGRRRDDDDGIRYLNCGPLTLKWSLDNWIYFELPQGRVEIAITEANNIEEVNCLDTGLTWHRSK